MTSCEKDTRNIRFALHLSHHRSISIRRFKSILFSLQAPSDHLRAPPDFVLAIPTSPKAATMAYGLPDWLTGSSQPASTVPKSSDGGQVAPNRNNREACYESRDIFFKCLDKHDILDANKEDEKARALCADENGLYERDCARSWV
jgi:hypothetical protein